MDRPGAPGLVVSATDADIVRAAVREQLIGPGRAARYERVLVACSGGADSLALAMATAQATARANTEVAVAVIDHQLQRDSAAVAQAVAEQCRRRIGLRDVEVRTVHVARSGNGPEAAARQARYAELEQVAEERECARVLLGHTADDQAETVLLGLSRGSGARSLAGMAMHRGKMLRPLLRIRRSVVRQAAAYWQLQPWQDPHNTDPAYARVRVREQVLPVFERELGPGIADALCRTADQLRADAEALDGWAAAVALPSRGDLPLKLIADLPSAVRSRVLRRWLIGRGSPAGSLAAVHVNAVGSLIDRWHGQGPIDVPGGRVTRSGAALRWTCGGRSG